MNGVPSNGFSSERSRIEPLSTRGIMAAAAQDQRSPSNTCDSKNPNKSNLRVEFTEEKEVKEKRERFLTAKYGVKTQAGHLKSPILTVLTVIVFDYES